MMNFGNGDMENVVPVAVLYFRLWNFRYVYYYTMLTDFGSTLFQPLVDQCVCIHFVQMYA